MGEDALRVKESGDQTCDRGFSAAGGADEGDDLISFRLQGQMRGYRVTAIPAPVGRSRWHVGSFHGSSGRCHSAEPVRRLCPDSGEVVRCPGKSRKGKKRTTDPLADRSGETDLILPGLRPGPCRRPRRRRPGRRCRSRCRRRGWRRLRGFNYTFRFLRQAAPGTGPGHAAADSFLCSARTARICASPPARRRRPSSSPRTCSPRPDAP